MSTPAVYLSPEQVCELVPKMTTSILQRMRTNRVGPTFSKPTQMTVVYKKSDVEKWLESTRVETRRA